MREIAAPFVVARPTGARVRTRLRVSEADATVLWEVGRHLGSLAGTDLARRCADGPISDRAPRKKALTGASSSRWAGAITRTSNDQRARARANQQETIVGLRRAIDTIEQRAAVPAGGRDGTTRGYRTAAERRAKLQRRDVLRAQLARLEGDRAAGRVQVVRGGRKLARLRHHLDDAGVSVDQWRDRWETARLFMTADGESGRRGGNDTIRWDPDSGHLELYLPGPLAQLANAPRGRYRLSCQVTFPHRGGEVAAQTVGGAVRYDITYDPDRARWYLDASWTIDPTPAPTVAQLAQQRTFAVDLNADHVAGWVVDPAGNPIGTPRRFDVPTDGTASHRDAQVRHLVTRILHAAHAAGCASVTIEDLNFGAAVSRDNPNTPRGARGRRLRRVVAGIPTARFRDRLTQMATNRGLCVVAVDPAYTSKWGRTLLPQLDLQTPDRERVTVHDGAAVAVGRRARGHGLPAGVRTLAPSPADDGRTGATPNSRQPARARQRATAREPSHRPDRHDGTRPPDVARSRQHRSDGTTTGTPPAVHAS